MEARWGCGGLGRSQSEISMYRKRYGLPAVTEDAKLAELARQQAIDVHVLYMPIGWYKNIGIRVSR
jgi:hypothetical protein